MLPFQPAFEFCYNLLSTEDQKKYPNPSYNEAYWIFKFSRDRLITAKSGHWKITPEQLEALQSNYNYGLLAYDKYYLERAIKNEEMFVYHLQDPDEFHLATLKMDADCGPYEHLKHLKHRSPEDEEKELKYRRAIHKRNIEGWIKKGFGKYLVYQDEFDSFTFD